MEIEDSRALIGCMLCRYAGACPVIQVKYTIPYDKCDNTFDKDTWIRICENCLHKLQNAIDEQWRFSFAVGKEKKK